jgi:predicted ester cyclase
VGEHIGRIFGNNPDMRFTTRSLLAGEDFAVCEWTLNLTKDGRSLEGTASTSSHSGTV